MRKIFHMALATLTASLLSGCYYMDSVSGDSQFDKGQPITTAWKSTGNFTALGGFGPDKVVFKTGDAFQIKAEGDPEVIKQLRFLIKDGKILVGRKSGRSYGNNDEATITITAPAINGISMAGSGGVTADRLTGAKTTLDIAGSGAANIAEVLTDSLDADIAGSGAITLAGKAAAAEYSIAGSGGLDASALESQSVKISIAGTGQAKLRSTVSVSADIAGSGNVQVTGGAKCKSSVSGSGSLDCT